ncbi:hypothetical protein HYH03_007200 [Edaphochlamys debaryana]|uniref:phytol kinase n=1 Tax=Edaphochlamys debaryana TaxID=47281 RepID=A0A835Y3T0_9CHLO|nr:hypothetical protein HYH03_007200 [Edaphochlamys debaryana]|eukprot:KAG2494684.1 hypothetical protein HYH03_007200 [Edaphochlamys debaryana]
MPPRARARLALVPALPANVREALKQLPNAAHRVSDAHARGHVDQLDTAQLRRLIDAIKTITGQLHEDTSSAVAVAVLRTTGVETAVLQLAAVAVRLDVPSNARGGEQEDALYEALSQTLRLLRWLAEVALKPPASVADVETVAAFIGKLLHMDTLQASARQLAAAAAALAPAAAEPLPPLAAAGVAGPPAAAGSPAGAGQAPAAPSMLFRERCCKVTGDILWLLQALTQVTFQANVPGGAAPGGAAAASGEAAAASGGAAAAAQRSKAVTALVTSLKQAMIRSSVVEHAARVLLFAQLLPGTPAPSEPLSDLHCTAAVALHHVFVNIRSLTDNTPADGILAPAVLGRCARHAALCLSICLMGDFAGLMRYGMPNQLVMSTPGVYSKGPAPYVLLDSVVVEGCVAAVNVDHETAGPDPHRCTTRRSAAAVLMRWGRQAIASLAAAEGRVQKVVMGKPVVRFTYGNQDWTVMYDSLLPAPGAVRIMVLALDTVVLRRLVKFGLGARYDSAGSAWDLAMAMSCHVARMDESLLSVYSTLLEKMTSAAAEPMAKCWGEHPGPLPPLDPLPPCMLAAYEGGLVPSLERLLRRAGQNLVGPEAHVANHLLNHERVPLLLSLLACAPPGEVASLTATIAKLLRLVYRQNDGSCGLILSTVFASATTSLLLAPRLFALMSGLPAASSPRLALTTMTAQLLAGGSLVGRQTAAVASPTEVASRLCMAAAPGVMTWVEALAERCSGLVGAGGSSGGAAGSGAGAAGSSGDAADGSGGTGSSSAGALGGGTGSGSAGAVGGGSSGDAAGSSGSTPGSSPGAVGGGSSDATAAGLTAFLLRDMAVVPLLGTALGLLERLDRHPGPEGFVLVLHMLAGACCAVAAAWPEKVRRAAAPTADGDSAPGAVPWPPAALRLLAWRLEEGASGERGAGLAKRVSALAAALETGGVIGVGVGPWSSGEALEAAGLFAATLAEAQALPPVCANPACVNLAGDSEAGLKLQQCGRCGKVSYCCRECQVAHWKAGHKEACSGGHREG